MIYIISNYPHHTHTKRCFFSSFFHTPRNNVLPSNVVLFCSIEFPILCFPYPLSLRRLPSQLWNFKFTYSFINHHQTKKTTSCTENWKSIKSSLMRLLWIQIEFLKDFNDHIAFTHFPIKYQIHYLHISF